MSPNIANVLACEPTNEAYERWRTVADRFRYDLHKLVKSMDAAEVVA